jgi:hypothetical protein
VILWAACEPATNDGYLPIPIEVDGPAHTLIVGTVTGDLSFDHTDEDRISGELVVLSPDDDFSLSETEGVVTLAATCANGESGCAGAFALDVPAGVRIESHTVGGDLRLYDLRDHDIVHDATTGDVYGSRLGRAMTLTATTTAGRHDVDFRQEPRSLTLTAETGDIEAVVPAGLYAVEVIAGGVSDVSGVTTDASGPLLRLSSQEGNVTLTGEFDTE